MARALRAWAINRGGKNSVRNLRYGPQTGLVGDIYRTNFAQHSFLLVLKIGEYHAAGAHYPELLSSILTG